MSDRVTDEEKVKQSIYPNTFWRMVFLVWFTVVFINSDVVYIHQELISDTWMGALSFMFIGPGAIGFGVSSIIHLVAGAWADAARRLEAESDH